MYLIAFIISLIVTEFPPGKEPATLPKEEDPSSPGPDTGASWGEHETSHFIHHNAGRGYTAWYVCFISKCLNHIKQCI